MTNAAVQSPVVTGIIQTDFEVMPEAVRYLQDKVREWADNPAKPLVLGKGVRFRQMRPDGTLEPDFPQFEATELVSTRDWLPYIFGASGWVAAIAAILVR
jgi:hypothetical protein